VQPSFWPALFFFGVALHRLDASDQALDVMAEVLRMRPGQPDVLNEMALLFDERGNAKRALECVDEALAARPEDAGFHANRATFLEHLGRHEDAMAALDQAIALEPQDPDYRRLRRRLR